MQRFVWNFEIDTQCPLSMDAFSIEEKEEVRWERRFFWPENKIIKLHGLNQEFLKLSNYTVKPRCDRYYVLADSDANIKLRRGEMLYKPLLEQIDDVYGFGKKIALDENQGTCTLNKGQIIDLKSLKEKAQAQGLPLDIHKETLVYKFPVQPVIKLELARLEVRAAVYFSVCIEGRSQVLVQSISKHLLKNQKACDYISFLKKIIGS